MTSTTPAQIVKYTFYKVDPAWRRLPPETRAQDKRELADVLAAASPPMTIRTYTLMGMRADADMMVWAVSPDLEHVQELATSMAGTHLGTYMDTAVSYLAMTRRSTYVDDHEHAESESRTRIRPMDRRYLFVYPFVKTHDWYQLPTEERQRMMNEHFIVGHRYPEVKIHTSYSYGLDDQEFVLGFETEEPQRFLDLIMELRTAEQRPYTERDVPIFTCLLAPAEEVLDKLGG
ncbi:MAG TPA: chlorite dismutase [Candidatus Latescibacteria bacterium]|nr:chlorite dismutase [Candidatus Latescibacterota bacterium]